MAEGILPYSGIENRSPRSFTPAATGMDRLLADVVLSLEPPAREAGCTIRLAAPAGLGLIRSDPLALRLILEHLLLNAIRHGGPGEIRLEVRRGAAGESLRPVVEDDGPGIPGHELLDEVWGYDAQTGTRTVDVHVAWLRRKLGGKAGARHIVTVRGRGYRFDTDPGGAGGPGAGG